MNSKRVGKMQVLPAKPAGLSSIPAPTCAAKRQ